MESIIQNTSELPQEQPESNGFIYFIHEKKYQKMNILVYKIGYTSRTVEKRLSDYEKGYKILYTFPSKNGQRTEKTIINIFMLKCELYSGKERFKGNLDEMLESIKKVENYDRNNIDTNIHHTTTVSTFYQMSLKKIKEEFNESDKTKNSLKLISSFTKEQMHLFLLFLNFKENSDKYIKQMIFHSTIAKPKKMKIKLLAYLSDLFDGKKYIPIPKRFIQTDDEDDEETSQ
jgi:hypothetical protein